MTAAPPSPAAAEVNDFDAMIAALDAPSDAPVSLAAGVASSVDEFQAQAPVAPEPAPAPAAVETPAAPAEPAPFDPTKELDPNLAKNWRVGEDVRVTAQNAVEQTAFKIRRAAQAEGKMLSLGEAEQEAYRQLGLMVPTPQAPAAAPGVTEPEPTAPADPLTAINEEIKALQEELKTLNSALDAERYNEVLSLKDAKMDERAELRADLRIKAILQEREEIGTQATAAEKQFAEVADKFEDLKDTASEFYQRFGALHNANVQADAPALADPDYERKLAAQVAGLLIYEGKSFKVKGAAQPAGSPPTGTPPAVLPHAAPRTAPAPAPMAALPGNHIAATSEHRVTVQQTDPAQARQQSLQTAIAGGDMDTVLAELDADLGGREAPGLKIFSIE